MPRQQGAHHDDQSQRSLPDIGAAFIARVRGGLHRAIDAIESGSIAGLRPALSQAMIAVEQELGAGSLDGRIVDPRFRSAMERLEAGLSQTLVLLWQTRLSEASAAAPSPELLAIARKLPRLAEQALDLLHESLLPVGGQD